MAWCTLWHMITAAFADLESMVYIDSVHLPSALRTVSGTSKPLYTSNTRSHVLSN